MAGFDPSLQGTGCLNFGPSTVLNSNVAVVADKSGAYLNDAQVQNELVAPHASDKARSFSRPIEFAVIHLRVEARARHFIIVLIYLHHRNQLGSSGT